MAQKTWTMLSQIPESTWRGDDSFWYPLANKIAGRLISRPGQTIRVYQQLVDHDGPIYFPVGAGTVVAFIRIWGEIINRAATVGVDLDSSLVRTYSDIKYYRALTTIYFGGILAEIYHYDLNSDSSDSLLLDLTPPDSIATLFRWLYEHNLIGEPDVDL